MTKWGFGTCCQQFYCKHNCVWRKSSQKILSFVSCSTGFCTVKSYQMMKSWACQSICFVAHCYLMFNNTQSCEKQIWPLPDLVFICTFAIFMFHIITQIPVKVTHLKTRCSIKTIVLFMKERGEKNKFQILLGSNNCSHRDFHGALGDSDPLSSAELFHLNYIGRFWCMNCPFKVTAVGFQSRLWLDRTFYFVFDKLVWGEPAGVFCCRT